MSALQLQGLTKSYDGVDTIRGIDLDVADYSEHAIGKGSATRAAAFSLQ